VQLSQWLVVNAPLQRSQERRKGLLPATPVAATLQHAKATGLRHPNGLEQQTTFADARLTRQQQHRRPFTCQKALQQRQLQHTTHDRRENTARSGHSGGHTWLSLDCCLQGHPLGWRQREGLGK